MTVPTKTLAHAGPLSRTLTSNLVVAVLYVGSAHVGLRMAFANTNATAVWIPSGIAIASLVLFGLRVWPGILLGAAATNTLYFVGHAAEGTATLLGSALLTSAGNTLEAVAGYLLLRRFVRSSHPFDNVRATFRFVALAAAVPVIAATTGVIALLSAGVAGWRLASTSWVTWWLGDVSGILVYAPMLLSWTRPSRVRWTLPRMAEAAVILLSLMPTGFVLFGGWLAERYTYSLPYLVMPLLLWVVFRFGLREASTAVAMVSAVAIWGTVRGHGPFLAESLNESLILAQFFASTVAVTVLVLSAAVAERDGLLEQLREVNRTLEDRIAARTSELASINQALTAEIRQRTAAEEVIKHLANHDTLTGLANRRLTEELFESAEAMARRRGHRMALLFLDLDGFKPINDEFGHGTGDEMLRKVAERLLGTVRESDHVARFGGDEFIVLLPDISSPDDATVVADKILRAVGEPFVIQGVRRSLGGASIGIAIYPHDGRDFATLVRCADGAMYQAKAAGKNRWVRCQREARQRVSLPHIESVPSPDSSR